MSSDGASQGVSAGRALQTILGGRDAPSEDERVSLPEMERRIRLRSLPGVGEQPWKSDRDDAYSIASEILAHAFLVLADEDPSVLTRKEFYDGTEQDSQWWRENMAGKQRDPSDVMWDAFKARWPTGDDWVGGASGFMVGWAFNAARTIKGMAAAPNPAIIEIASGTTR